MSRRVVKSSRRFGLARISQWLTAARPVEISWLALLVAGSVWLLPAAAGAQNAPLLLPTPAEHYAEYDLRSAALTLVPRVAPYLDAATMQRFMAMASGGGLHNAPELTPEDVIAIIDRIDLEPMRIEIIELLIHGSSVLDMVPEGAAGWVPIVHPCTSASFYPTFPR